LGSEFLVDAHMPKAYAGGHDGTFKRSLVGFNFTLVNGLNPPPVADFSQG
jgi:hypothetical protein